MSEYERFWEWNLSLIFTNHNILRELLLRVAALLLFLLFKHLECAQKIFDEGLKKRKKKEVSLVAT